MMTRLLCWLRGWRRDLDDWIVRAKRASDPTRLPSEVGFVEDACVAVRTWEQARALDGGIVLTRMPHDE
jgi:hypothetical protein